MADKTYAQLGSLGSISDGDLLALWPPAGPGPLQTVPANLFKDYTNADNGTASVANTGTSGHTLPFLDGANTWSAAQSFGDIEVSGNAQFTGSTGGPEAQLLAQGRFYSARAALDMALTGSYNAYRIIVNSIEPSTDGAALWARVSINNGSSYRNGGGDYQYAGWSVDDAGGSGANSSQSAAQILVGGNQTSSVDYGSTLELLIENDGSANPRIAYSYGWAKPTTFSEVSLVGKGRVVAVTSTRLTNIRLLFSTGNIARAAYSVYGVRGLS